MSVEARIVGRDCDDCDDGDWVVGLFWVLAYRDVVVGDG